MARPRPRSSREVVLLLQRKALTPAEALRALRRLSWSTEAAKELLHYALRSRSPLIPGAPRP